MYLLNVLTTLNIFRAALPSMRAAGRGSLVAIGAGAAVKAPSGLGAYAGAKSAAVHRLARKASPTNSRPTASASTRLAQHH